MLFFLFQITKLKIDSNPFAKGFRDSSRLTEFERWVLRRCYTALFPPFTFSLHGEYAAAALPATVRRLTASDMVCLPALALCTASARQNQTRKIEEAASLAAMLEYANQAAATTKKSVYRFRWQMAINHSRHVSYGFQDGYQFYCLGEENLIKSLPFTTYFR